jgi:hypothetical protein
MTPLATSSRRFRLLDEPFHMSNQTTHLPDDFMPVEVYIRDSEFLIAKLHREWRQILKLAKSAGGRRAMVVQQVEKFVE